MPLSPATRPTKSKARTSLRPVWLFACLSLPILAQAQTDETAARELQRQQERERTVREREIRQPDVRIPTPAPQERGPIPSESPCFTIQRIQLIDPTGIFGWAQRTADEDTGRCLGSRGINRLMARVQDAIIARGFVTTRVLAAPQDLRSGTLKLTIVPGRIHTIRFSEDSDERANAFNAVPAAPGDLLNLRDIEQALENFKRLPSAEADIEITPADAPGESDVVITWKQGRPLRLTLSADNSGARSTGRYQGSATLSGDNLLALNDIFYVSLNRDLGGGSSSDYGTRGHTVHYSLPLHYWTLGFTASANRYRQTVAGLNEDYLYSGTSENYEARLSRVIYRDATNKTSAFLRAYLTKSANFIDDVEVEVQRRRMAGWEAGVQNRSFLGQATLDLALAYRRGTGAFGSLHAPEEAFDEGTARPVIITTNNSLDVPFEILGRQLRYAGTLRAQWNQTPLVPQDRFSIGGRHTVRGFDGESVLMAERGWLIRNDLGLPIDGSDFEFYLGIDHGRVGGPSSDLLVGKRLTGAVIGLRGQYKAVSCDLLAGRPLAKPDGFQTDRHTFGFNLSITL